VIGPGDDPTSEMGPLITREHRDRVAGYIGSGADEGATVVVDGREQVFDGDGYFLGVSLLDDVTTDMQVYRDEIFGPVLSIIGYEDEDDAIRIANDSDYGLSGGVWSSDADRALAVAKRLRTGEVDMNGSFLNTDAPFGGYKKSGNGRELGRFGLAEFLEAKQINLPLG